MVGVAAQVLGYLCWTPGLLTSKAQLYVNLILQMPQQLARDWIDAVYVNFMLNVIELTVGFDMLIRYKLRAVCFEIEIFQLR